MTVDSGNDDRPASFHHDYAEDWGAWVLEHGLPPLPSFLGEADEVPVAYWAGTTLGAVLFLSWASNDEEEEEPPGAREVNYDHCSFARADHGWHPTGGWGGTAGPREDPMQPPRHPERYVRFFGEWQDGHARGLTGGVGAAARTIELQDQEGRTRRPVDAPMGLVIVCFDLHQEVTIRILDGDGQPLLEMVREASSR